MQANESPLKSNLLSVLLRNSEWDFVGRENV